MVLVGDDKWEIAIRASVRLSGHHPSHRVPRGRANEVASHGLCVRGGGRRRQIYRWIFLLNASLILLFKWSSMQAIIKGTRNNYAAYIQWRWSDWRFRPFLLRSAFSLTTTSSCVPSSSFSSSSFSLSREVSSLVLCYWEMQYGGYKYCTDWPPLSFIQSRTHAGIITLNSSFYY